MTFPVAAVSDGGYGTVMNMTIRVAPGNGSVFVGIPPYSGTDLQRSIVHAVDYADVGTCDVFVDFNRYPGTSYVDGPSAGAAIASFSYILANDLPVVHKPIITGAVSNSGSVLPVGGIYEKALISTTVGVETFLVPKTNLYDYIMLKKVEERYGLKILVVNSVEETVDYITGSKIPDAPDYPDFESPAQNISPYYSARLDEFVPVAADIIDFENYTIKQLREDDAEDWLLDYFEASIDENNRLLSLGYVYTAANNAFIGYIDLSTIVFVYSGEPTHQEKYQEISECLSEIERPAVTSDNFEWVIGSDLRKAWADEKLNSTEISDEHLIEEEYSYFHEIMYADAWCRASKGLAEVGMDFGGKAVNEAGWKEIAENYINTANITKHNPDTQRRFDIAQSLFEEGKYGAAIFDSVYVASMDLSELELSEMEDDDDVETAVNEMLLVETSSLWSNIYKSQAVYLIEKEQPEYGTAYSLLLFSIYLDEAVGIMESNMVEEVEEQPAMNWTDLLLISASFILFFFVLVYILPRILRRSYEKQDNKADRAYSRTRKSSSKGRLPKTQRRPGKGRRIS